MSESESRVPPTGGAPAVAPPKEGKAKSTIRLNAEKDESYRPYCMRCPGLVRMTKVAPFYWTHSCGAIHDEREGSDEVAAVAPPREPMGAKWKHDERIKAELLAFDEADEKLRDLECVNLYGKEAEAEHGPKVQAAGDARAVAFYAVLDAVAALAPRGREVTQYWRSNEQAMKLREEIFIAVTNHDGIDDAVDEFADLVQDLAIGRVAHANQSPPDLFRAMNLPGVEFPAALSPEEAER